MVTSPITIDTADTWAVSLELLFKPLPGLVLIRHSRKRSLVLYPLPSLLQILSAPALLQQTLLAAEFQFQHHLHQSIHQLLACPFLRMANVVRHPGRPAPVLSLVLAALFTGTVETLTSIVLPLRGVNLTSASAQRLHQCLAAPLLRRHPLLKFPSTALVAAKTILYALAAVWETAVPVRSCNTCSFGSS
jgi:hypothetical protein